MYKIILFLILIFNFNIQVILSNQSKINLKFNIFASAFNESLGVKFFESPIKNLESKILNSYKTKNDELCLKEIEEIQSGLFSGQLWAYKVVDSWGKLPSGILMGRSTDYGNFEECLGISQLIDDEENNHLLEGKYCLADIPLSDLINRRRKNVFLKNSILHEIEPVSSSNEELSALPTLKIGICIPKSCEPKLADDKLREILELLGITLDKEKPIIVSDSCQIKSKESFTAADIIAICIFSFIGFLMLISSIYDYIMHCYNKQSIKILTAFSILSNGEKLFKIQGNSNTNSNTIECVNGIRCLSIIWVVFGHQYSVYISLVSSINAVDIQDYFKTPFLLLIYMGTFAVDSFFLLSGCLLAWCTFKTMDKSCGRLNIFKMYLHRYLRLTPLLAGIVLFTVGLQKHVKNGPAFNLFPLEKYCEEYWWSTLIYVSNYVNPDKMCVSVSWYLCVDTQLFVLSPLILWPLWKWGKIAFLPIIVAIQASMGYVFAEWMYRDYHLLPLESNENDLTKQKYTYFATHARVSPYLIGIILGYYLHQNCNKKLKFSKLKIMIGWLSCLIVMSTLLFGLYHRASKQPQSGMTTIEGAIFESLSRCLWAISLSWIIFACHHGYGGLINEILTFGIWQPLARLSYGIYLIHGTVQVLWYGNFKIEQHFSNTYIIFMFWACFGLTICISIITALAFESPVIIFENWIFGSQKKNNPSTNKDPKAITADNETSDNNHKKNNTIPTDNSTHA